MLYISFVLFCNAPFPYNRVKEKKNLLKAVGFLDFILVLVYFQVANKIFRRMDQMYEDIVASDKLMKSYVLILYL